MRERLGHIGLVLLILIQSVSTLAYVPNIAFGDGAAEQSIDSSIAQKALQASSSLAVTTSPCHPAEAVPKAPADHSCCEDMQDAACMLHCFSVASAVSIPSNPERIDIHARYPDFPGYAAPLRVSGNLYRPPRIS